MNLSKKSMAFLIICIIIFFSIIFYVLNYGKIFFNHKNIGNVSGTMNSGMNFEVFKDTEIRVVISENFSDTENLKAVIYDNNGNEVFHSKNSNFDKYDKVKLKKGNYYYVIEIFSEELKAFYFNIFHYRNHIIFGEKL
jgi:hypothetical protein